MSVQLNWFITGVSSGIGRALAEAVVIAGGSIAGTVRRDADLAEFEKIAPGRTIGLSLDVADTDRVGAVVDEAISRLGHVDIVVNNAGTSLWGAVEETHIDEAKALFATNVFGPMAVMQAFMPHFRERNAGRFVNLSSGCGLFPVPGVGVYSASKFALEALTGAMAAEVKGFGVDMMLVEPGAVATRFISHGTADLSGRNPAYAGFTGGGKGTMDPWYASALSSENVAAVIVDAVGRDELPLHLVIGEDTRLGARAHYTALLEEIG